MDNDLEQGNKFAHGKASIADAAAHGKTTMNIPHFINEAKSDMRGIKHGWYAIDNDGKLSSGPFSSHEECLSSGTQPLNRSISSK